MIKNIKYKVSTRVLSLTNVAFWVAMALIIPTIGLTWNIVNTRIWYIVGVIVLATSIGFRRLMRRLEPVEQFRLQAEAGEPVDDELLAKARHLALLFPVSGALVAPIFLLASGILMAIDLRITFHLSFAKILLVILTTLAVGVFLSIFVFFAIKSAMRPIIRQIVELDPNFTEITTPWKLRIRPKLMICFMSLGVLVAVFILLGNTLIENEVTHSVSDPAIQNHILSTVRMVFGLILVLAIGSAISMAYFASRDLSIPLNKIAETAEAISRGESATRINIMTEDEVGDLARSINRMTFGLLGNMSKTLKKSEQLLKTLQVTSKTLSDNTWELSSISTLQAENATQLSVGSQQISSTSIEISQSAKQIADTSRKVNELAGAAHDSCEKGSRDLESTLDDIRKAREHASNASYVIEQLKVRSEQIQAVIDIIEEISRQINLLSVNAALEAIGAGAAGKRFGTVAEEVSRLADKTAEAITQIRKIIIEATKITDKAVAVVNSSAAVAISGTEKANKLESSFNIIRQAVEGTAVAAQQIELTTRQQASSSDQMVETISNIAENAQELESNAQRLKSNSDNLAQLVEMLKNMTAVN